MTLETNDSEQVSSEPAEASRPDFEWPDRLAIERIDAITRNARTTWFGLLGLLAFVMVTLLGVEDIDFFGYDRATKLPLIGVAVPTTTFFIAAPILTAAVYAYFHFYLMKLWDALGRAPARVQGNVTSGDPIGDLIHPWLLSDAALVLRTWHQRDGSSSHRSLQYASAITSATLTWGFGWIALVFAWFRSWSAHDEWLSLGILFCLLFTFWVGGSSAHALWLRTVRRDFARPIRRWPKKLLLIGSFLVLSGAITTWIKTEGGLEEYLKHAAEEYQKWLLGDDETAAFLSEISVNSSRESAPKWLSTRAFGRDDASTDYVDESLAAYSDWIVDVDLRNFHWSAKPEDWSDRDVAEEQYRRTWCSRRDLTWALCVKSPEPQQISQRRVWCTNLPDGDLNQSSHTCDNWFMDAEAEFQEEWRRRRSDYLSIINKPVLTSRDLRAANLESAFLPGVDLTNSRLDAAILSGARLEASLFENATLNYSQLQGARMEDTQFKNTMMQAADLSEAQFLDAVFLSSSLVGSNFSDANFSRARFVFTGMEETKLSQANFSNARLSGIAFSNAEATAAKFTGADLSYANLDLADLRGADFRGANLTGTVFGMSLLEGTDFTGAIGLTQEQLQEAIGNEETILPRDSKTGAQLTISSCQRIDLNSERARKLLQLDDNLIGDLAAKKWFCLGTHPQDTGRAAK